MVYFVGLSRNPSRSGPLSSSTETFIRSHCPSTKESFRHGAHFSALCFGPWLLCSGDISVELSRSTAALMLTAAILLSVVVWYVSQFWVSPVSKDVSYLPVLIPVGDECRQFCLSNGIGTNSGATLVIYSQCNAWLISGNSDGPDCLCAG